MFLAPSNIGDEMSDCCEQQATLNKGYNNCDLGVYTSWSRLGILVCAPVIVDRRNRFLSKQNFSGQKCIGSN